MEKKASAEKAVRDIRRKTRWTMLMSPPSVWIRTTRIRMATRFRTVWRLRWEPIRSVPNRFQSKDL